MREVGKETRLFRVLSVIGVLLILVAYILWMDYWRQ